MEVVDVYIDDGELRAERVHVGTLSLNRTRGKEVTRFEYSKSWLGAKSVAFEIDPELLLAPGPFHAGVDRVLHRVFRDMSPDRWGRVLMARREAATARAESRERRKLGDWEFFVGVDDLTRVGGLRLFEHGTTSPLGDRKPSVPPMARLRELEAAAALIEKGDELPPSVEREQLNLLLAPGSSLGGARPKANCVDESGSLWIAKFPSVSDTRDVGAWEFLAHELAKAAGLDVPEAQCLSLGAKHRTFCVRRFDRRAGSRRVYVSAMTLTGHDDGDAASYLEICEAIAKYGDAAWIVRDLRELYRRIVFSILVSNFDDHLRNHGFLRGSTGWRLAPAFDVNPSPDRNLHALAIDEDDASPDLDLLLSTAQYYRLGEHDARTIEDEVRAVVRRWRDFAAASNITPSERHELDVVFARAM